MSTTTDADQDLAFAGATELSARVRAREVSPRELVELFLRRIEALDPKLNAFRTVMAEQALAEADAMGSPQGRLAGVPVAIKDCQQVAGQTMTLGSRTYGPPQPADAEIVRRIRAEGGIPIGITNVPELMMFPWTATEANGITRNPWNLERSPGGSSGGSGAAVAAGLVPVATGSDGAGSIRIPAACNGLVGLKPSRGRVSLAPDVDGWLGLSVSGALTRTVRDAALMLDVMSGPAAGERGMLDGPSRPYAEVVSEYERAPRLRVAATRKLPPGLIARLSADQRLAWERTQRLLGELGHTVEERAPAWGTIGTHLVRTYARGIHEDASRVPDPKQLEPYTRQMSRLGALLVPDSRRASLLAAREGHVRKLMALWNDFDVLLLPGLARTALPAEGGFGKHAALALNQAASLTPWTGAFNLSGQPGISIPAGLGADGMPLAVQLVGRIGAEDTLLALAAELEAAQPWERLRPPIS